MRLLFDLYNDETCWTRNDEFDDTIEVIDTSKGLFDFPIRHMCVEVRKPTDLIIEHIGSHALSTPSAWEYQGDNTYSITECMPAEVECED